MACSVCGQNVRVHLCACVCLLLQEEEEAAEASSSGGVCLLPFCSKQTQLTTWTLVCCWQSDAREAMGLLEALPALSVQILMHIRLA